MLALQNWVEEFIFRMTKVIINYEFYKVFVLVNFMCQLYWLKDAKQAKMLFLDMSKGVS